MLKDDIAIFQTIHKTTDSPNHGRRYKRRNRGASNTYRRAHDLGSGSTGTVVTTRIAPPRLRARTGVPWLQAQCDTILRALVSAQE